MCLAAIAAAGSPSISIASATEASLSRFLNGAACTDMASPRCCSALSRTPEARATSYRPQGGSRARARLLPSSLFRSSRVCARGVAYPRRAMTFSPRAFHAHVNLVEPAILRVIWRRVAQHVVAAVAVDDPIERRRERVGVESSRIRLFLRRAPAGCPVFFAARR